MPQTTIPGNTDLLVIKASAGSGKTFTLALRYIEQLLFTTGTTTPLRLRDDIDYHRHIVAITFTNKATNEMKRRIIKELYLLAQDATMSDYYDYFKQRCSADDLSRLSAAARRALSGILFEYGSFNVSTIDSFFQSILRNFAREIDRDYNYELQIDEDHAIDVTIHNFLLSLGRDAKRLQGDAVSTVEGWVRDYLHDRVAEKGNWNFFNNTNDLKTVAKKINTELFRQHMGEVRDYLSRVDEQKRRTSDFSKIHEFRKAVIQARNHYKDAALKAENELRQICIGLAGQLSGTKSLYKRYVVSTKTIENDNLSESFLAINASNISGQFKNKFMPDNATLSMVADKVVALNQAFVRYNLLKDMPSDLSMVGLLGKIDEFLELYRKESGSILIADANELIGLVLQSDVPFIYERVGTWINHYMIDEFQDTSRKQYDNFKPLLDESLSHSSDNFNMLIGDAKQSIYRFRNADVSLFRDKIETEFAPEQLHHQELDTNYRSARSVVRFNNSFFEQALAMFRGMTMLQRTYDPNPAPGKTPQYKQLEHDKKEGLVQVYRRDNDKEVIDEIAQFLLQLHDRFDWSEIGILVNENREGSSIVAKVLEYNKAAREQGLPEIPIMSSESMHLKNSVAVRRIVSLLRFIDLTMFAIEDEGENDEQLLDDIKSRVNRKRLKAQRLFHVLGNFVDRVEQSPDVSAHDAGELLKECFELERASSGGTESEQMDAYATSLGELLPDFRSEPITLGNIVEHIIARYITHEKSTLPQTETAFLLAFQDVVAQFASQRKGSTVREFLRFWDDNSNKLSVQANAGDDAINVVTIHKSKGLEYKCVVIPFANWNINIPHKNDKSFWITSTVWLEQGGKQILEEASCSVADECVPPLLKLNRSSTTNLRDCEGTFGDFVQEQEENLLIDQMNKTYVAFTRACEELHIFAFCKIDKKGQLDLKIDGSINASKLIFSCLPDVEGISGDILDVMSLGATDPDRRKHRDEEAAQKDQKKAALETIDKAETVKMPNYAVTPTTRKVQVRLPRLIEDKRLLGNRLHNLMSRIRYRRDVERALHECVRRGVIADNDTQWGAKRLRVLIYGIMQQPETASWFADDNKVYNERTIHHIFTDGGSERRENRRPDRIVVRPDGRTVVIDYKFGGVHESYASQMKGYMRLLQSLGKTPIEGHIWYLDTNEIVDVTI